MRCPNCGVEPHRDEPVDQNGRHMDARVCAALARGWRARLYRVGGVALRRGRSALRDVTEAARRWCSEVREWWIRYKYLPEWFPRPRAPLNAAYRPVWSSMTPGEQRWALLIDLIALILALLAGYALG